MLRSRDECTPGEAAGDRIGEKDNSGTSDTEKGIDLKSSLGITVMKETYASGELITIASITSPLCGKVAQKRRLT